jgi:flagellar L-ring protein precursor FlgH
MSKVVDQVLSPKSCKGNTHMKTYIKSISITIASAALTASLLATPALCDSLYPQTSTNSGMVSLFSDTKAHNVGDVLTINVAESSTGNSTATTNASKTDSFGLGPGSGSILSLIRSFGLSDNINSAATGATNRSSGLTATLSVVVKQVFSNGTMLVEGQKQVEVNSEMETTTITGIVRQVDVGPDNTIDSGQVANAQITYSGKGPVGDKQHDGIVTKLAKILF